MLSFAEPPQHRSPICLATRDFIVTNCWHTSSKDTQFGDGFLMVEISVICGSFAGSVLTPICGILVSIRGMRSNIRNSGVGCAECGHLCHRLASASRSQCHAEVWNELSLGRAGSPIPSLDN